MVHTDEEHIKLIQSLSGVVDVDHHGASILSSFTKALGKYLKVEDYRRYVGGDGHVLENVLTRRIRRFFRVAQVDWLNVVALIDL